MRRPWSILLTVPFTSWAFGFFVLYHVFLLPVLGSYPYDDGGIGTLMFVLLPSLGWMFQVSHELVTEAGLNGAKTLEWIGGFVIAGAADTGLAGIRAAMRRARDG